MPIFHKKMLERVGQIVDLYLLEYEMTFDEPKIRSLEEYRPVLENVLKQEYVNVPTIFKKQANEILTIARSFANKAKLTFRFAWIVFVAVTLQIEDEQIPPRQLTRREINKIEKEVDKLVPHNY